MHTAGCNTDSAKETGCVYWKQKQQDVPPSENRQRRTPHGVTCPRGDEVFHFCPDRVGRGKYASPNTKMLQNYCLQAEHRKRKFTSLLNLILLIWQKIFLLNPSLSSLIRYFNVSIWAWVIPNSCTAIVSNVDGLNSRARLAFSLSLMCDGSYIIEKDATNNINTTELFVQKVSHHLMKIIIVFSLFSFKKNNLRTSVFQSQSG